MASNLAKRLITGILGSAFGITLVVYNFYTFSALCALLVFLLLQEFYTLTKEFKPFKWLGVFTGLMMILVASLVQLNQFEKWQVVPLVLLIFGIPLLSLFDKDRNIVSTISITFTGLLYIVLPLILFVFIADGISYNRFIPLGVFLIIWSNDTGAYFAGKTMGKNKLFERVSPNKTIEGTVGGIVLAFIIISILYYFFDTQLDLIKWFILTIVVSVSGSLGDLIESQIKRTLKIKDSGSILPGHGGFLDRFDALIFAIPFAFCCALFF